MGSYWPYVRFGAKIEEQTGADVFVFFDELKFYQLTIFYPLLYFIVVRIHIGTSIKNSGYKDKGTPWDGV